MVACSHVSGLLVRSHMTAGLDGFRGSRPYQLVEIRIPLRRSGFSRSVGSTDCAITCFHSRKLAARGSSATHAATAT